MSFGAWLYTASRTQMPYTNNGFTNVYDLPQFHKYNHSSSLESGRLQRTGQDMAPVYRGSYPIDQPISVRSFARANKSYEIESPCCDKNDMCPEHEAMCRKMMRNDADFEERCRIKEEIPDDADEAIEYMEEYAEDLAEGGLIDDESMTEDEEDSVDSLEERGALIDYDPRGRKEPNPHRENCPQRQMPTVHFSQESHTSHSTRGPVRSSQSLDSFQNQHKVLVSNVMSGSFYLHYLRFICFLVFYFVLK